MHDLLRGYARELSATVDGDQAQQAALTRLFDHYLHTAAAAIDTLCPVERHLRPRIPRPDTPVPPLPDPAAALEWLDRERATLPSYLRIGGHFPEALIVFGHALGAARRTGDVLAAVGTPPFGVEKTFYRTAGVHPPSQDRMVAAVAGACSSSSSR